MAECANESGEESGTLGCRSTRAAPSATGVFRVLSAPSHPVGLVFEEQ